MEFRLNELKKPDKSIIPLSYLDKREPAILTEDYVAELNREISYRIRECETRNSSLEEVTMYPVMGQKETKGNQRKLIK